MTVKITSYAVLASEIITLAGKKAHIEFAADIRYALLNIYARQQAGTFTTAQFELVGAVNQELFYPRTIDKMCGVYTNIELKYSSKFTDR